MFSEECEENSILIRILLFVFGIGRYQYHLDCFNITCGSPKFKTSDSGVLYFILLSVCKIYPVNDNHTKFDSV